MTIINITRYCVVILTTVLLACSALAGQTLTAGGEILPAVDTTSADGGSWHVFSGADTTAVATGAVGTYASGYWAGEVGNSLGSYLVGDQLTVMVEKESGAGTVNHTGYFASVAHTLSNEDPALFSQMMLQRIPTPYVFYEGSGSAELSWQAVSGSNVVGYHVYRSSDGISFLRLTALPLTVESFTDNSVQVDTSYYAISLVFDGTPSFEGVVLSENSNHLLDIDDDGLLNDVDSDDDNDGIDDDGDGSGTIGDNPCIGGSVTSCDDNCINISNSDQADTDNDAQGNLCDICPLAAPARVVGTVTEYYPTIWDAYDNASDGDTIQCQESTVYVGDIDISENMTVYFEGGYDCNYSTASGVTTVIGNVTSSSGGLIISNGSLEVK